MRLKTLNSSEITRFFGWAIAATGVLLALPSMAIWLGLPPEGDAVDYRIPLIKWMAAHNRIPNWPWSMVDDYPLLGEIIMAILYKIDPHLMRLVPIGAYIGLGWAAQKAARQWQTAIPGTLIFAWILALRPLALQSNLLMVDNLASFFCVGALAYLLGQNFRAAGIFCALALATRYTAWAYSVPLFFVALYMAPNGKKWKNIAIFVGISSLGAIPFILRNIILNHNPIFPMLGSIFNGASIEYAGFGYGRGKDLISFLLLPYDLLYTNTWVTGFFDYTIGKLFYFQLIVVFGVGIAQIIKKRNLRPTFGNERKIFYALLIFFILQTILWFLSSQQLRFLVPALVALNILMFSFIWNRGGIILSLLLTLLCLPSYSSIQMDSIKMAMGKMESPFALPTKKALDCFSQIPANEVVGIVARDGMQGFIDQPFIFYPPVGYALPKELYIEPAPEFIYQTETVFPGYELWPKENPCMTRKLKN